MSIAIHAGDSLTIRTTVTDNNDVAKDLSSAVITALALKSDGKESQTTLTGTVALVSGGTTGIFDTTFLADLFTYGKWIFQPRVVIGTEEQIVVEKHIDVALSHV